MVYRPAVGLVGKDSDVGSAGQHDLGLQWAGESVGRVRRGLVGTNGIGGGCPRTGFTRAAWHWRRDGAAAATSGEEKERGARPSLRWSDWMRQAKHRSRATDADD